MKRRTAITVVPAAGLLIAAGQAARGPEVRDIPAGQFAADGIVGDGITVEATWPVPPQEAFRLFTSSDAWLERFELQTRIDLAIGGRFELLFGAGAQPPAPEGSQGSEGCQILSYLPGEMLSFSWNAPPSFEERAQFTWVVITFAPGESENTTALRLRHVGFGEGGKWAEVQAYFENAWPRLLGAMGEDLKEE
jgi:uncharacterized protein YndB with AHSA1/START domain